MKKYVDATQITENNDLTDTKISGLFELCDGTPSAGDLRQYIDNINKVNR